MKSNPIYFEKTERTEDYQIRLFHDSTSNLLFKRNNDIIFLNYKTILSNT